MNTAMLPAPPTPGDAGDVAHSVAVPTPLKAFDEVGLLGPADVHTAAALCRLGGDDRDEVLLAAALAVRAPRLGHVCIDLTTAATSVVAADGATGEATAELRWPQPEAWLEMLAASPLVHQPGSGGAPDGDGPPDGGRRPGGGTPPDGVAPLVLDGPRLYLDRYWRYERGVVRELTARVTEVDGADLAAIAAGLDRLLPRTADSERPDRQRLAAATAVMRHLTVVAGGPGTGKTTTVAAVLALLHEQADTLGQRAPRIALAAPTGKAAARLTTSLHEAADRLDVGGAVRAALRDAEASTLHRLLRRQPGARTRFRYHRNDPLPHDVVVVDETSMVSLSLIAKLLDAVRHEARLVLLGDPHQLASVEAGTVLGDLVGPAGDTLHATPAVRERLTAATGEERSDIDAIAVHGGDVAAGGAGSGLGDSIVVLHRVHRFSETSGIAALAAGIHGGDPDAVLKVLGGSRDDVTWVESDDLSRADELADVRGPVAGAGGRLVAAARAGDARAALAAVEEVRVLCAHRRGPYGVASWIPRVERWLGAPGVDLDPRRRWYVGRPVIVTRNDHRLGVFNGDVGVTLADGDGVTVAFEGPDGPRLLHPGRLEAVETVHAMTIHRSQGSQFGHVVVVLPDVSSPILTRELLYTAVTRAKERVTVVGARDAIAAAVSRPIARASGLRAALWGSA